MPYLSPSEFILNGTFMYKTRIQIFIYLVLSLVFLAGCSSKFVIVDESGMTFNLRKTKLTGDQYIEILDGEAVRLVPLKKILKLVLDPTTTHFRDNKLYYHASIELTDGTEIKPRINGENTTKSFVNIDNVIAGRGTSGKVTIPLQNINILSQSDIED